MGGVFVANTSLPRISNDKNADNKKELSVIEITVPQRDG